MITGTMTRHYRTIFLSDIHLGSPHSQTERLLALLRTVSCETICLAGDVFDAPGSWLPSTHRAVIQVLLSKMATGTEVVYVPGNHDAKFRKLTGDYGPLLITRKYIHHAPGGKRYLVLHGDEVDILGSGAWLHAIDRKLPAPFWEMLRIVAKRFMRNHVKAFERRVRKAFPGFDLLICGHVHRPAMHDGYVNLGDWIKHCTLLVEHLDGRLEMISG